MGQSPSSDSCNASGIGLPFYQGNADFGKEHPVPKVWCDDPKKTALAGDILISVRAPIGAVNIASEKCCIGRGLAAIRSHSDTISQGFLKQQLLARKSLLESKGTGSTFRAVGKKVLLDFPIRLYPLREQVQIEERLKRLLLGISVCERYLAKLDDLRKSRFIEMFGDPIINPKKLPVFAIEELAAPVKNAMKAGPFGSALKKSCYVESGYKVYGQEQVISGNQLYGSYYIDEAKYRELESCRVKPGDVLISLVGTVGKVLILTDECEPGIINPRLVKITFDSEKISPDFFSALFSLESVRKVLLGSAHGQTMDVLNLGMIKRLRVPLPSVEEQIEYLAFVVEVDKLESAARASIDKLQTLYDSLAQEYFG